MAYYDSNNWHKEVSSIAVEGARNHGLLNIPVNDFFNTLLLIPSSIIEQKAIGEFFRQLDDTIATHQRETVKLQQLKEILLKKMFV